MATFQTFRLGDYQCEAYTKGGLTMLLIFDGWVRIYERGFPAGTPLDDIKRHAEAQIAQEAQKKNGSW